MGVNTAWRAGGTLASPACSECRDIIIRDGIDYADVIIRD